MWVCPKCQRQFGRVKQGHECSPAMTLDEYFSTGPDRTGTHWGQLFLPAFEPLSAGRGARLRVSLSMAERASDWRWSLELRPGPVARFR